MQLRFFVRVIADTVLADKVKEKSGESTNQLEREEIQNCVRKCAHSGKLIQITTVIPVYSYMHDIS